MTVQSSTRTIIYRGNNATTVFDFPFYVVEAEHLVVYTMSWQTNALIKTYSADEYTVSGLEEQGGGSITILGDALPPTSQLVIQRTVPYVQELVLDNQGGFYPKAVEGEFDEEEMQIQQLADILDHALLFPIDERGFTLPTPSVRADTVFTFDPLGAPDFVPFSELFDVLSDFDGGIDEEPDGQIFFGGIDG